MEFAENLILRMMEDPRRRDEAQREHIYAIGKRCGKAKANWSVPLRPTASGPSTASMPSSSGTPRSAGSPADAIPTTTSSSTSPQTSLPLPLPPDDPIPSIHLFNPRYALTSLKSLPPFLLSSIDGKFDCLRSNLRAMVFFVYLCNESRKESLLGTSISLFQPLAACV